MSLNEININQENGTENEAGGCGMLGCLYLVIAIVIGCIGAYLLHDPEVAGLVKLAGGEPPASDPERFRLGLTAAIIAMPFITAAAYVGALLGDVVRKLAMPDSVWVAGGLYDVLGQKFFWFVGPQLCGAAAGGLAMCWLIEFIFK